MREIPHSIELSRSPKHVDDLIASELGVREAWTSRRPGEEPQSGLPIVSESVNQSVDEGCAEVDGGARGVGLEGKDDVVDGA